VSWHGFTASQGHSILLHGFTEQGLTDSRYDGEAYSVKQCRCEAVPLCRREAVTL
jgi:hypothetical protein